MKQAVANAPASAATMLSAQNAGGTLYRKCACGNHTTAGDSCDQCKKKNNGGVALMRYAATSDDSGLAVSQPGDALEREADAAAERIVGPGAMPAAPPMAIAAQLAGVPAVAPGRLVSSVLRGPSSPLPTAVRSFMEDGFGQDFSRVRVHHDAEAARSSAMVGAQAYTVGDRIIFGEGQFMPETPCGRRLLAHELTHVVQQTSGRASRMIARKGPEEDAACSKGHRKGEAVNVSGTPEQGTVVYLIWGTWKEGDNSDTFQRRTMQEWIAWRFGGINAQKSAAILSYAMDNIHGNVVGTAGCQIEITMDHKAMLDVRKLSGEAARDKAAADQKKAEAAAQSPAGDQSGTAPPATGDQEAKEPPGGGRATGDGKAGGSGPGGTIQGEPGKTDAGGLPSIGKFGPLSDAVGEDRLQDQYITTRIKPDVTVLTDPKRAELYLQILQHHTGRAISDADTKAAADGLDQAEVNKVVERQADAQGVDRIVRAGLPGVRTGRR